MGQGVGRDVQPRHMNTSHCGSGKVGGWKGQPGMVLGTRWAGLCHSANTLLNLAVSGSIPGTEGRGQDGPSLRVDEPTFQRERQTAKKHH